MAERPIALVLKTRVGDEPTVGSNPTLSARNTIREQSGAPDYGAPLFDSGAGECTLLSRLPAERGGDFCRDQLDRFERFLERRQAWLHLANEIGRFAKQRLLFETLDDVLRPSPVDVVVLDLFIDGHRGELGARRCRRFKTGFDIAIGDVWITGRIDGA